MTSLDAVFMELLKHGGISGALISMALVYLGLQVRALNVAVDGVRQTIGEKVFPKLDEFESRISTFEGQYKMWIELRTKGNE